MKFLQITALIAIAATSVQAVPVQGVSSYVAEQQMVQAPARRLKKRKCAKKPVAAPASIPDVKPASVPDTQVKPASVPSYQAPNDSVLPKDVPAGPGSYPSAPSSDDMPPMDNTLPKADPPQVIPYGNPTSTAVEPVAQTTTTPCATSTPTSQYSEVMPAVEPTTTAVEPVAQTTSTPCATSTQAAPVVHPTHPAYGKPEDKKDPKDKKKPEHPSHGKPEDKKPKHSQDPKPAHPTSTDVAPKATQSAIPANNYYGYAPQ